MKEKQVLDTDKLKLSPGDITNEVGDKMDEKTESNKYADNQFFGNWISYKTTHSIMINGTTKDSVPNMMERIQLTKAWEITPIPQILRKQ